MENMFQINNLLKFSEAIPLSSRLTSSRGGTPRTKVFGVPLNSSETELPQVLQMIGHYFDDRGVLLPAYLHSSRPPSLLFFCSSTTTSISHTLPPQMCTSSRGYSGFLQTSMRLEPCKSSLTRVPVGHWNGILIDAHLKYLGLLPDLALVQDPHVVAGLLKLYFRELPVPLLTFELYDCFLAAACMDSSCSYITGSLIAFILSH